ncbi:MAG TPA: hypothetical protein VFI22_03720, partial [Thermomicrobiales bacterium]|nr:hypothetical protein [Thermomicrobiales bacterium]
DGPLAGLIERFSPFKTVTVEFDGPAGDLGRFGEVIESGDGHAVIRVPKAEAAAITAGLLAALPVIDLSVADPPVDEVIDRVFSDEPVAARAEIVGAAP